MQALRTYTRQLLAWLWAWRQEWLGLPVALALFVASPVLLWFVDPSAGTWDVGVLSGCFVAAVQLIVANTMARIGAMINYRHLFQQKPKDAQCRTWYAALFALYFLAFLLLLTAL